MITKDQVRKQFEPAGVKTGDAVSTQKLMQIEFLFRDLASELFDLLPANDLRDEVFKGLQILRHESASLFIPPVAPELGDLKPKTILRKKK